MFSLVHRHTGEWQEAALRSAEAAGLRSSAERLDTYNPGTLTRFVYDGQQVAAGLDSSGAIQHRYVTGDDADEVLVDYAGSGTTNRRFLSTDERGSVISATDSSGDLIGINSYDEHGKPGASNIGRFQYTGQEWLPEAGVYRYKTREYLPHLGIFAQTDPLRYEGDSPNLYAYTLDDPVDFVDPLGLKCGFVDPPPGTGPPPGGCPDLPELPSISSVIGGISPLYKLVSFLFFARVRHHYTIRTHSSCSANSVFNRFKDPGISAPGAPRAQEGTRTITLAGDNPVDQTVTPSTRTIVNVTDPPHLFFPGSVTISVTPTASGGSNIQIVGQGSGRNFLLNDVIGNLFFGQSAKLASQVCGGGTGLIPVHGG